jgi:NMT1-like family
MHQYGLDLECLLEFFNTHGAEVTPGSNVVGEDLQSDRLGHALPSSPAIRSGHCRAAGGSGNANPAQAPGSIPGFRIVKAVFEHHDELVSAHPAAKETLAANLDRDTFLPLHPGAARYYREIGIAIPPAIAPAP